MSIKSDFSESRPRKVTYDEYLVTKIWLWIAAPVIAIVTVVLLAEYIDHAEWICYLILTLSVGYFGWRYIKITLDR